MISKYRIIYMQTIFIILPEWMYKYRIQKYAQIQKNKKELNEFMQFACQNSSRMIYCLCICSNNRKF